MNLTARIHSCLSLIKRTSKISYVRNVFRSLHRAELAGSFILPLTLTTIVVEKEDKGETISNGHEGYESERLSLIASYGPSLESTFSRRTILFSVQLNGQAFDSDESLFFV